MDELDEQPKQPTPLEQPRKGRPRTGQPSTGQFGSSQPNQTGRAGVKSRRTILIAALKKGIYRNKEWLERLDELKDNHGLSAKHQLTLLRRATDPEDFFLEQGSYLSDGLQRMDLLEAEIEGAKNPSVADPAKLAGILAAIATKTQPIADSAKPTVKPSEKVAEIAKPAAAEKRTWLEQMTGKGTNWEWPKCGLPKAEKPIPPNKYEKVTLPPVVESYQVQLPGEDRILKPVPAGSVLAAFIRNRKIEFVETGHVGNTVTGKIVVSSPGLSGQAFSNIRQSHFKTWQENNFSNETVPSDMREDWKSYLRSIDGTLVPSARTTRPTIDESLDYGRLSQVHVNYPAGTRKARKWGTKADDAKRRGPRHQYGDPGADLAAMLDEARNRPGTDL
jgi:hypothetical protein